MVAALNAAESDDERESAEQAVYEDPLSIQVRTGWYSACDPKSDRRPQEFEIPLCTGGPAGRISGRLDEHQEPESARIEHQDWGTPWTEYREARDDEALLAYCRCFCFGE